MKYVKTYEQVRDFYKIGNDKFLVISEDEQWYLKPYEKINKGRYDVFLVHPISELNVDVIDAKFLIEGILIESFITNLKDDTRTYMSEENCEKHDIEPTHRLSTKETQWSTSIQIDDVHYFDVTMGFKKLEFQTGIALKTDNDPNL